MRIDLFKKRMIGLQQRRARRGCAACAPKAVRSADARTKAAR